MSEVIGNKPVWFGRQGVLLIGYDVETDGGATGGKRAEYESPEFFPIAGPLHRELQAPCTLFVRGKTLDLYRDAFRAVVGDPLFEFAQHTYSHRLLKTVMIRHADERLTGYVPHADVDMLAADVEKAQTTIAAFTGARPVGFCAP